MESKKMHFSQYFKGNAYIKLICNQQVGGSNPSASSIKPDNDICYRVF